MKHPFTLDNAPGEFSDIRPNPRKRRVWHDLVRKNRDRDSRLELFSIVMVVFPLSLATIVVIIFLLEVFQ